MNDTMKLPTISTEKKPEGTAPGLTRTTNEPIAMSIRYITPKDVSINTPEDAITMVLAVLTLICTAGLAALGVLGVVLKRYLQVVCSG